MDGFGPVVLVAQDEAHPRLDARNLQMLEREKAYFQEVLELAGQLALVVHDHKMRARHRHEGQLHIQDLESFGLSVSQNPQKT